MRPQSHGSQSHLPRPDVRLSRGLRYAHPRDAEVSSSYDRSGVRVDLRDMFNGEHIFQWTEAKPGLSRDIFDAIQREVECPIHLSVRGCIVHDAEVSEKGETCTG